MHTTQSLTEQHYLIGGLAVNIVGGASLQRIALLPEMRPFIIGDIGDRPCLTMHLDVALPPATCPWLTHFDIADGSSMCRFGRDADGCYHYVIDDRVHLYYDPRHPDELSCTAVSNLTLLYYVIWLAYSLMALRHGRMPIHSSAVVCKGRAVMCLGESGTGKSTHTRLWLDHIPGTHLLNDDSPILAINDEEILLYGSPWSGKTPCYRQECVPVAAMVRIEQKPSNSIQRLHVIEAFTALQPSCPPSLATDERLMDLIVANISRVLRHTPIYRLGCRPDAEAARLCYENTMGDF